MRTIECDFSERCPCCGTCGVSAHGHIRRGETTPFIHENGDIETSTAVNNATVSRPESAEGKIVVSLDGVGVTTTLSLSLEAAKSLGMALIRATALPVGD